LPVGSTWLESVSCATVRAPGTDAWGIACVTAAVAQLVSTGLFESSLGRPTTRGRYAGLFQRLSIAIGFGWLTALLERDLFGSSSRRAG
jgi:hypothetical protein